LGSKAEPWLIAAMKRVNRVKKPLNSVPQQQKCLSEILSSANAIRTLASMMVAKAPAAELDQEEDLLAQAIRNYEFMHLQAYVVHVDMVHRHEVAFKLTTDTIESLIKHHKEVYCPDVKADTRDWPEKEQQCKKLHADYIQAVNRFVFRTDVSALEGMEEQGAGELMCVSAEEAKNNVLALSKPLLPPPPPRVVEVVRAPAYMPSSPPHVSLWCQPMSSAGLSTVESWRVLHSNSTLAAPPTPAMDPSMTVASTSSLWSNMNMNDVHNSPPLSCYSPSESYHSGSSVYDSPPQTYPVPYTTGGYYWSAPEIAPVMPSLPLPSMFASSCGLGMGMGSFGWDHGYQGYATTM